MFQPATTIAWAGQKSTNLIIAVLIALYQ